MAVLCSRRIETLDLDIDNTHLGNHFSGTSRASAVRNARKTLNRSGVNFHRCAGCFVSLYPCAALTVPGSLQRFQDQQLLGSLHQGDVFALTLVVSLRVLCRPSLLCTLFSELPLYPRMLCYSQSG